MLKNEESQGGLGVPSGSHGGTVDPHRERSVLFLTNAVKKRGGPRSRSRALTLMHIHA